MLYLLLKGKVKVSSFNQTKMWKESPEENHKDVKK